MGHLLGEWFARVLGFLWPLAFSDWARDTGRAAWALRLQVRSAQGRRKTATDLLVATLIVDHLAIGRQRTRCHQVHFAAQLGDIAHRSDHLLGQLR